jgi:glycerophosphoryl diester phosphodiesterase
MILPLADLVVLLRENPQVCAFIEVKRCTLDHHGIETVYQRISDILAPVKNQCILISFSLPFIQYARAAGFQKIGFVTEFGDQALTKEVDALAPDYIFCDYETMPTKITDFHSQKATWVIYEIDRADVAQSLYDRGIRFIETFDYVGLRSGLESQGVM